MYNKNKKATITIALAILISISLIPNLVEWKTADAASTSDLLLLPAVPYGWQNGDSSHNALMTNPEAGSLVSVSKQDITASPGQTISIDITYQVYVQKSPNNPSEIDQLFFAESWTKSWPPQGYTISVYEGMPGISPGVTQTKTISVTAPSESGTYYLWLCFEAQYSMQDAVNQRVNSMNGLPAHIKITVPATSTSGLVGYWSFDEGAGTSVIDRSGNGNTGTLVNSPQWVNGIKGTALSFDGINDYLSIQENTDLDPHTSDWTMSTWVNIGLVDPDMSIPQFVIMTKRELATDSSLTLIVHGRTSDSMAKFAFVWDYPGIAGAETPLMNVLGWHNVVGIRRGTDLYVYVDGVGYGPNNVKGSFSEYLAPNTNINSNSPIQLCHHGAWNKYYKGIVDEVKIYNYARTTEQIQSDYNSIAIAGNPSNAPSLSETTESNQSIDLWLILSAVSVSIIAVAVIAVVVHRRKKLSAPKATNGLPTKPVAAEQDVCPNCGAKLPEGSKFCGKCGTALK